MPRQARRRAGSAVGDAGVVGSGGFGTAPRYRPLPLSENPTPSCGKRLRPRVTLPIPIGGSAAWSRGATVSAGLTPFRGGAWLHILI